MCNNYEQHIAWEAYCKAMQEFELRMPTRQTEFDLPQADDIRIGDIGPVIVSNVLILKACWCASVDALDSNLSEIARRTFGSDSTQATVSVVATSLLFSGKGIGTFGRVHLRNRRTSETLSDLPARQPR
jgi:hypothetical protein